MKDKGLKTTPAGSYNQSVSQIRQQGDLRLLSLPKNKKAAENIQRAIKLKDPAYKPSGNQADEVQAVWNMCASNKTFVRRVAMDSDLGSPEIYIR